LRTVREAEPSSDRIEPGHHVDVGAIEPRHQQLLDCIVEAFARVKHAGHFAHPPTIENFRRSAHDKPICLNALGFIRNRRSLPVFHFRQALKFLLRSAGQLNLATLVIDLQRIIGHRNQSTANAEEAADLQHRIKRIVVADDQIIERANLFILVVGHTAPKELADAVSLVDVGNIDFDQVYAL
jgi:hypothetical protein